MTKQRYQLMQPVVGPEGPEYEWRLSSLTLEALVDILDEMDGDVYRINHEAQDDETGQWHRVAYYTMQRNDEGMFENTLV